MRAETPPRCNDVAPKRAPIAVSPATNCSLPTTIMSALRTRAGIRCCTLLLAALTLGDCSDATSPHETYPGGGQLIAFVSSRDGNSEIYSMHPDGSHVVRLTNSPAL